MSQNTTHFELAKIVVVLDGYEDEFSEYLSMYHNEKVKIFKNTNRKGKSHRLNQIFETSETDLVITLDTDIDFANENVLDNLVIPFLKNSSIGMVSGKSFPTTPNYFVEKVSLSSILIWEEIKSRSKNPAFTAEGTIRCFCKALYKQLRFPNKSADDIYSYLACTHLGFKYFHQKKSIVNYKTPKSWVDFYRGQIRFLSSLSIQEGEFNNEFVKNNFCIKNSDRIAALLKVGRKLPLQTIVYIFTWIIAKITIIISGPVTTSTWKILLSTKK